MINIRSAVSLSRSIGQGLLDFLYPPLQICPLCGKSFEGYYSHLRICTECLKRLPLIRPPSCAVCGRPIRGNEISPCSECRREPRFYKRGTAVALYDGMMKELLHTIKYDFRPELAKAVGSLLAVGVEDHPCCEGVDLIIPVPLYQAKVENRGYNQAELMAGPVAEVLRKPLLTKTLVRVKPTESQSKFSRRKRKKNIFGAFAVVDCAAISGKKLLLIDDITTTGYTLSECAGELLLSGAKEINAVTAAIGVLEESWQT